MLGISLGLFAIVPLSLSTAFYACAKTGIYIIVNCDLTGSINAYININQTHNGLPYVCYVKNHKHNLKDRKHNLKAHYVRTTEKKYIKLCYITNDLEKLRESSISEKSLLAQCKKTKRDISGLSLCRRLPNVLNDSCTLLASYDIHKHRRG